MHAGHASTKEDVNMVQKCEYRAQEIVCRHPLDRTHTFVCQLCLAGQQIDSIERLTSAIMSFGMDSLEKEANK